MARERSLFNKELSKKQSNLVLQDLLKKRIRLQAKKHIIPGNIIFTSYNAKDKSQTYDKTPLALILKRGSKHSLVLNFHWLPISKRMYLINIILEQNKQNIKNGKPLNFDYQSLKPLLKSIHYAPCVRRYINSRMGRVGVPIPPSDLVHVAKMKAETFTEGRYSAAQLYQMAKKRYLAQKKQKNF